MAGVSAESRRLVRAVVKRIHPDLFQDSDFERNINAESLKILNGYMDVLSKGSSPRAAKIEFFIRDMEPGGGGAMRKVSAQLSGSGNLSPLFFAFGLIDEAQLQQDSMFGGNVSDTNFLSYLREQVGEAVRTAERHDMLRLNIRKLRTGLEEKYQLSAVQVGAEYAATLGEQERQVDCLRVLEQTLSTLNDQGLNFEGTNIQLYHPKLSPMDSKSYYDEGGTFRFETENMRAYIGDDGRIHVVADPDSMTQQLAGLDLERARTLTQAAYFWVRRVRELSGPVTQLLGVKSVWCETKVDNTSQKFVLWAGYLLEKRDAIAPMLKGKRFSFSLIVHSDPQSPLISFHASSPILNVSADCPPEHLLEFLVSEAGLEASEAASSAQSSRIREEALLEEVRQALEAKCVIKICMNDRVVEGARRLLENAEAIRSVVDLKGCCLALDDCYEVWDSGFISIPFDFKVQDLPEKVRMLKAGQRPSSASAGNAPFSHSGGDQDRLRNNVVPRSIKRPEVVTQFPRTPLLLGGAAMPRGHRTKAHLSRAPARPCRGMVLRWF